MTSQNNFRKNGLMILWSLLPFAKAKDNPFADISEPETGGQFKLYANYPNPFHTITIIYFALMHTSRVQIDILDAKGRQVMTLANETFEAGVQRVPLYRTTNGTILASGNYLYRLTVSNENGTYNQTRGLTLL